MIPLWVPVALIAVVLWVIGNITDKFLIEKYFRDKEVSTGPSTLLLFSLFSAIPTAAIALLCGADMIGSKNAISIGLVSGLFNGLYLLSYLKAVERTELSRVIPVAQSVPIFGFILAWFLLDEQLSGLQIFSGALILLGAVTLLYHRKEGRFDLWSFLFMLSASFCIATQMALFKVSALDIGYWSTVLWSNVGLFTLGLCIYSWNAKTRSEFNGIFLKKRYKVIAANAINELNETIAILVFSAATLLGPLALVQSVTAYQPIILLIITTIAAKFGFDFLKEDISKSTLAQKIIGIALVGIGSALVYLPLNLL